MITPPPPTPPSGIYNDLMEGYFGLLGSNQQNALWQEFLQKYKILDEGRLDDIHVQAVYGNFIQSVYTNAQQIEQLSTDEIKKRQVVFTVFDILLKLLQTVQENVGVMQQAAVFFAKYQKEYTDQMSNVGFYRGESSNIGSVDFQDLSQWTLGYADISMEEYILAAISPPIRDVSDPPDGVVDSPVFDPLYIIGNPRDDVPIHIDTTLGGNDGDVNMPDNRLTFQAFDNGTGKAQRFEFTLNTRAPVITNPSGNVDNRDISLTTEVVFGPDDTLDVKLQKASEAFLEFVNQTFYIPNEGIPIPHNLLQPGGTGSLRIGDVFFDNPLLDFGPVLGTDGTDFGVFFNIEWERNLNRPFDEDNKGTKAQTKGGEARAARNQLLQQYLENARTRRETLANQQDSLETTLDASRDALTRTAEIISSTIKQLSNLITSIFKPAQ